MRLILSIVVGLISFNVLALNQQDYYFSNLTLQFSEISGGTYLAAGTILVSGSKFPIEPATLTRDVAHSSEAMDIYHGESSFGSCAYKIQLDLLVRLTDKGKAYYLRALRPTRAVFGASCNSDLAVTYEATRFTYLDQDSLTIEARGH